VDSVGILYNRRFFTSGYSGIWIPPPQSFIQELFRKRHPDPPAYAFGQRILTEGREETLFLTDVTVPTTEQRRNGTSESRSSVIHERIESSPIVFLLRCCLIRYLYICELRASESRDHHHSFGVHLYYYCLFIIVVIIVSVVVLLVYINTTHHYTYSQHFRD